MRFSGVALVVLAIGHLFIMLMWDNGVYRIDFNYVAQRWASPFWQFWDLALLWLAQLHGGNGLRTIIDDYSRKDSTRFWLNSLLLLSMGFTLVLGTYVLLTFDPNISEADPVIRNTDTTWSSSARAAPGCGPRSRRVRGFAPRC